MVRNDRRIWQAIAANDAGLVAKSYRLRQPELLDPIWLLRLQGQEAHSATVEEDGTVQLAGERLSFLDEMPAIGAAVKVRITFQGFLECATVEELDRVEAGRHAADEAHAEAQRQRSNGLRDEAITANERIRLPVRWDAGIKDVLSGLSDRSMGDGRRRNTVTHIWLREALALGRLRRETGDFLCTARGGSNGKRWSGQTRERAVDGDGVTYTPQVNCKSCLALARRFTDAP